MGVCAWDMAEIERWRSAVAANAWTGRITQPDEVKLRCRTVRQHAEAVRVRLALRLPGRTQTT